MPRWAQAGGRDSLQCAHRRSATREKMLVEMRDNLRRRGGDSTLLLTGGSARPPPVHRQDAEAGGGREGQARRARPRSS